MNDWLWHNVRVSDERKYVTLQDVAASCGVGTTAVSAWVRDPAFPQPVTQMGTVRFYDADQITAYLQERQERSQRPGRGRRFLDGRDPVELPGQPLPPQNTISLQEVADILGVGQTAMSQWQIYDPNFPQPVAQVGRMKLYDMDAMNQWIEANRGRFRKALD